MASNQRLFNVHPLLIDSSRLRFSQATGTFDMTTFNKAARADKRAVLALELRTIKVNQKTELSQNYLLIRKKGKKPSVELLPICKIIKLLRRSPNAPNTLPALSLAAA